jgi:hypothetical protein
VVSCSAEASGGVELLAGGVLLLGGVLVLGDVLVLGLFTSLDGGAVLLLGLFTSLDGGVVLLLGEVELLGLLTSLCGMLLPVPLQSVEIIFTLLTLIVLELEDEGLVLPDAVPVALPLAEFVPVTWIRWPTCSDRFDVSPCSA